MSEVMMFLCQICGALTQVFLEPGDAETWVDRGCKLCAPCLERLVKLE